MQLAGFKWGQTTVAKTEGGTRPVRVNEAVALAACFGLTINELLPSVGYLIEEDADKDEVRGAVLLALMRTQLATTRLHDIATRLAALNEEMRQVRTETADALELLSTKHLASHVEELRRQVEGGKSDG
jgi:hypothetical protein